ncbi:MAG: hypothetical protein ACI93P_002614, partial [bacterium]
MTRHILLVIITITTGLITSNCGNNKEISPTLLFSTICDVDTIINDSLCWSNNQLFNGGKSRTKEGAFSGEYALKITSKSKYGFGLTSKINKGNHLVVTAWRKKCIDCGLISIKTPNKELIDFYGFKIIEEKEGWEKIMAERVITTSITKPIEVLVFYFNNGAKSAIVDDFKVDIYSFKEYPEYPELTQVRLIIDEKEHKELNKYAIEALKIGVLKEEHKNKIKAKLLIGNESYKVKIRLKGDWIDHLKNNKWSYRVELDEDKSVFGGLKEFSIQSPETRHNTEEYFLHKLADEFDILNTRFGFIQLKINDRNFGIYSFEEHFTKQLIESRKRREGPIVKFDEEPFWDFIRLAQTHSKKKIHLPFYYAAQIIPFDMKKTSKTESLYNQFCQANILMQQYKSGAADFSEIFDIDKTGMFLAYCDFANVHHTLAWHNQRLYYNPVINKLEPILFDAFQPIWPGGPSNNFDLVLSCDTNIQEINPENYLVKMLMKDSALLASYNKAIQKLMSTETNGIIDKYYKEAREFDEIMQREFQDYSFNDQFFKNRLQIIEEELVAFNEKIKKITYVSIDNRPYNQNGYYSKNNNLKVFIDTINNSQLLLENYHGKPIKVTRIKTEKSKEKTHFIVPSFTNIDNIPGMYVYPFKKGYDLQEVNYKFEGNDFKATIYPWPKQVSTKTVLQGYKETAIIPLPHTIKNDTVWVAKGKHTLSKTMTMKEGKTLVFAAGTTIDMINGAKIICFGSLSIIGTKTAPVSFITSDK